MRACTCYLYIVPARYEDIAKLGISHDPLARVRAFSARFYDSFDLERSLLVAFERRAEAQARETQLHRRLRDWNAPQPLAVADRAGGRTEWYRGAQALLLQEVEQDRMRGHVVHAPAAEWWRSRLEAERHALYEWGSQWWTAMQDAADPDRVWQGMVDVLDAWPALGLDVADAVPPAVADRHARHRAARGAGFTA